MAEKNESPTQDVQLDELLAVDADSITTLIDAGVVINGSIHVANGRTLLVGGTVRGEIHSDGAVVVNSNGCVYGSVKAQTLQVAGLVERVKDDDVINVAGAMVLASTAVVNCDAVTGGLKAAYGAVMSGRFKSHEKAPVVASNDPHASDNGHNLQVASA